MAIAGSWLRRAIARGDAGGVGPERSAPVQYTPTLIAYAAGLVAVSVIGLFTLGNGIPIDYVELATGSAIVFALTFSAVPTVAGLSATHWSSAGLLHLLQSFLLGPVGALGAALGHAAASGIRYRSGWFRVVVNTAISFVINLASWLVFTHTIPHTSWATSGLSAALAGGAQLLVNVALLAGVVRLSTPAAHVVAMMRDGLRYWPYNIGYGWAALGGVLLYQQVGTVGVTFLIVPVVLVQVFLITLARGILQADRQRTRHAQEREELYARVQTAAGEERMRIVHDLHDGVVQDLASVSSGLLSAAMHIEAPNSVNIENLARATQAAIEELREMLPQLAAGPDDDAGLGVALDSLAKSLRSDGVAVAINIDSVLDDTAANAVLVRIANEALRNVASHACATEVTIAVVRDGEGIEMLINDNGQGFAAQEAERKRSGGHMGVMLLGDLAREAGGFAAVTSQVGLGTEVRVRLPKPAA